MNFGFSSLIGRGKRLSLWRSLLDVQENETPEDEDEMMLEDSMLNDGIAVQRSLFEEEFHRPMVQGVLAVKIRSAVLSQEVLSEFRCLYCTIMLRNFIVRTSVVSTNTPKIVWDQIKHFPARVRVKESPSPAKHLFSYYGSHLQVVRNRMHPFNHVKVQLLGFDSHGREREVGAVAFHLHEIIKASPISGMYDVWGKHFEVGQMELELTFSYGMFGYGSSVQLQDEDILPEEAIQYSLMPRINPAQDLCEPEEPVLAVQAVPHPGFIPFRNKVHLSYGKDIQNELEEISRTMYRPEILMQDFEAMEHVRHKVRVG
nr:Hyaluronan and proteoglycan link protein 1 [Polyrhizophydium stewartii]